MAKEATVHVKIADLDPVKDHIAAMAELFRSAHQDAKVLADIVDDLRSSIVAACAVLALPDRGPAKRILLEALDESGRAIRELELAAIPGDEDNTTPTEGAISPAIGSTPPCHNCLGHGPESCPVCAGSGSPEAQR